MAAVVRLSLIRPQDRFSLFCLLIFCLLIFLPFDFSAFRLFYVILFLPFDFLPFDFLPFDFLLFDFLPFDFLPYAVLPMNEPSMQILVGPCPLYDLLPSGVPRKGQKGRVAPGGSSEGATLSGKNGKIYCKWSNLH